MNPPSTGISAVFNTYPLTTNNTSGINTTVSDVDYDSKPVKNLTVQQLARVDKAIITNSQYAQRIISLSGSLIGTNRYTMEAFMDQFKMNVEGQSGNLDIDYNGATRRFIATTNQGTFTRGDAPNKVAWTMPFICAQPFAEDVSASSILAPTTQTNASTNYPITAFAGSAYKQYPVVTITVNSFTGSSLNIITIQNNLTGQYISFIRAWAAGDVLIADFFNQVFTVNGVAIDFAGVYYGFAPGAGGILVTNDFTACNLTVSASQQGLYF